MSDYEKTKRIRDLVGASSLGTPAVVAARASVSPQGDHRIAAIRGTQEWLHGNRFGLTAILAAVDNADAARGIARVDTKDDALADAVDAIIALGAQWAEGQLTIDQVREMAWQRLMDAIWGTDDWESNG